MRTPEELTRQHALKEPVILEIYDRMFPGGRPDGVTECSAEHC